MTGDGSENAVGQPVEIRLSRVALKALADLPDMACGYLSPLARIGAPKGPSQREPLVAALEMMRGPWEWAVPALLDPHMTVALLLGDGETTLAGQYLWPDADGAGPGFKAAVEGQELRIEGPVDLLQVEQYLLEFLSLSAVPEIEPVRLSLNRDEFWATLALADGYRTATLRRKLAREGGRPLGIAVRDVVDAWQTGIASPNPGWSVSLFAMLAPAALPAGFQIRLPEVLETMGRSGLLERLEIGTGRLEDGTYLFGEGIEALLQALSGASMGFGLAVQRKRKLGEVELTVLGGWRSSGGLAVADVSGLQGGSVDMFLAGPQLLVESLDLILGLRQDSSYEVVDAPDRWRSFSMESPYRRELILSLLRNIPAAHRVAPPPSLPGVGSGPVPISVQPDQVIGAVCGRCGAQLKVGARFCVSCGSTISQPSQAATTQNQTRACRKCQAPLAAGAGFCTKCGTPTVGQ